MDCDDPGQPPREELICGFDRTLRCQIQSEQAEHFARAGVLKRVSIPDWVRRAVFFRDRGLCVLCHRDLTGIVNIWSNDKFDHIVPLAAGGLNDVSNIQLLCRECNSKKHAGTPVTSNRYEAWYPEDEG
jgi:5-methylcytosine-specific restriction endonuclease McrA